MLRGPNVVRVRQRTWCNGANVVRRGANVVRVGQRTWCVTERTWCVGERTW